MIGQRVARPTGIAHLVQRLFPGASLEAVTPLGCDEATADEATEKGVGYGKALKLHVRMADGTSCTFAYHTASPNDFGHDRRSDRAEEMLLGYDTFSSIPRHVEAVDVGAVDTTGELRSLRDCGEFYLLTEFAEGKLYADDLRRIGRERLLRVRDLVRCEKLAAYLAALHAHKGGRPALYTRAVRDLVGHGEGIYGIVDGYASDAPGASPERIEAIEKACADYRWRLRGKEHRLSVTHGDFHPFNILFDDDDEISLLDASRGCHGDPADDVSCLAINYVFFALQDADSWKGGFRELWHKLWDEYLARTGDTEILEAVPPYLAWRVLVITNPAWYPNVTESTRDKLLGLAERALDAGRFDPAWAEELFA